MKITPGSIVSTGHVVLTGPITGSVTLDDGTTVDVTAPVIEVDDHEQAAKIAHAIGKHWEANGHPDDREVDEESGELVQRPFVYDDAHHQAATKAAKSKKG